ncbi:hypothetical protein NIES2109_22630 [Nostoc sp. HK-01]|nr:hypothetical protein NIES2109_22630 [Nostoc sp. HK-01]
MNSIKRQVQFNSSRQMHLQTVQQVSEEQAKLAEARYQNGCVHVKRFAQGIPVYRDGLPLPKGTVICDDQGNTGVLQPRDFDNDGRYVPVIADTAYTGRAPIADQDILPARYVK